MPADAFMAVGSYGQTVVVVPSRRLVIARFGTTYDLRTVMVDICRLTADTIRRALVPMACSLAPGRQACQGQPSCAGESSPQSRGGEARALHERLELRPHDGRVLALE